MIPITIDRSYWQVQDCTKRGNYESFLVHNGPHFVSMFDRHVLLACLSLAEANQAFSEVVKPSQYTWNSVIAANAKFGLYGVSFNLYDGMQNSGFEGDKYTYLAILQACIRTKNVMWGQIIHAEVIRSNLHDDVFVGTAMIDMYAKCGSLENARRVFDELFNRNEVSWGAMIAGYVQHGDGILALECFQMMQSQGLKPNKVILLSVLKACGIAGAIRYGRFIHELVSHNHLQLEGSLGTTLVDMYAKCGNLVDARKLFDSLSNHNVVSWSAMISGYVQNGEGFLAIECFESMQAKGIAPDKVIFSSILRACSTIGAIDKGRQIHKIVVQSGDQSALFVANALIDLYAKCGDLEESCKIFRELRHRDVVSWNTMIAGYIEHGEIGLVRQCLAEMQLEGTKPNEVTFATIISACTHAGLIYEGKKYFNSMIEDYGIIPDSRHYNCIIDLLGRAGYLKEAETLISTAHTDIISWTSLLSACKTYGNVEMGKRCFDQFVQMDPHHSAGYMMMSKIYSDASMQDDATKIEDLRRCEGAWRKPAKAWIEVNSILHEFVVTDKSHPQSEEIYHVLKDLNNRMNEKGSLPDTNLMLQRNRKEENLCGHCEKLAIAFGILSTPQGTVIRATKNLRMCIDCHNFSKFISKLERREIIIRDAYRMHHFKDGCCSCGDFI